MQTNTNNQDYFNQPPDLLLCQFCQNQMEESRCTDVIRYSCHNHKPLVIKRFLHRKNDKWLFKSMYIQLPNHYELYFIDKKSYFRLLEWKYNEHLKRSLWRIVNKTFPKDWVLSQSPERLLSILQMYKTFS